MLPNALSTTDSGPADAAAGPQLKLAARTTQDVRDAVAVEAATAAVGSDESDRSQGQWRHTLDAVKGTLAGLERTWESAFEAHQAGVAGLIDTLVGTATAEAAAAQDARAQCQIEKAALEAETADFQAAIAALRADLQMERDRLKGTSEQLDVEIVARVRAESEREEAGRVCQQVVLTAESKAQALRAENDIQKVELAQVRQQLEAARAERSKLMATFQSVQRVLTEGHSGDMAIEADAPWRGQAAAAESGPQAVPTENTSGIAPARADLAFSLAGDEPVAVIEAHPEAVEDVKQVLEQVEAMYAADLSSGRYPMEVVDSLTGSLRYARDVVVARWSLVECDATALFDQQVATLLDSKAGTSFGRHLSISAYASRRPAAAVEGEPGTVQQPAAE